MAQTVRLLDTSSTSQDQTAILGLEPQHVEELMPSEKVGLKNLYFVFIVKVIDGRKIKRDLSL